MSGKNTMPSGVTIVIPSYNPDNRLLSTVLELVSLGADDIIVVNDGSSDTKEDIFSSIRLIPGCTVLTHYENRGKGAAIKTAMAYFIENRPQSKVLVTVDGDGHHKALDIVSCAHRVMDSGLVILGVREKNDGTIKKKGRFGNRVTSFAIKLVCDFDIEDPLTGLRGIPAKYVPTFVRTKGDAYDFETNMILDFKRKNVPFRVFHIIGDNCDDGEKSHYRPFRDSVKIFGEILKFFGKQFKYLLSSLGCYFLEYLVFRFLLSFVPAVGITIANYISRLMSGTANFLINKKMVFKMKKGSASAPVKYVITALLVMVTATEMIVLINGVFATKNDTVAKYIKIPVDCVMFFFNYWLQKTWVFKEKKTY